MLDESLEESTPLRETTRSAPSWWQGFFLAVFLGGAVMAIGAIPPNITLFFCLGSSVILGGWLLLGSGRIPPIPIISWVFLFLALWTLIQCFPLPISVLAKISPGSAEIWRQSLRLANETNPTGAPLTLAPEQTWLEASKWGAYAGLSFLGAWWARYRGISTILWAVLSLSLCVGTVTVLHGLWDAQTIFGIYKPLHTFPRWTRGPLLNVNHLSAYLSLGFYAALALLLGDRTPSIKRATLLFGGALALVVGILALASRAAVVALLLGGLLMPLVLLEDGRGKRSLQRKQIQQKALITLVAVFGTGATLALYGFEEGISKGLGEKNFSKLQVAYDSLKMIQDFWLTGVGRGAFEGVFFYYKSAGDYEAWGHPENLLVQWASEWGIPVTLLALGGISWAVFRSPWRASRSARVLMLGLGMLLLHNLLDFNLEVPAIGGLVATLWGAVTGGYLSSKKEISTSRQRIFLLIALACTVLTTLFAWSKHPEIPLLERKEAYQILQRAQQSEEPLELDTFQAWMRRYPADPYFPAAAGLLLGRTDPSKAMSWFAWALRRGPNLGVIRLGLAEVLGRSGYREQALLEVRLAVERDPSSLFRAIGLVGYLATSLDDIRIATPKSNLAILFQEGIAKRILHRREIFSALRHEILQRSPCIGWLQESIFREQLADLNTNSPPCSNLNGKESCLKHMEETLSRIHDCPNLKEIHTRLHAEFIWTLGNQTQALEELERACSQSDDLVACFQLLAEWASNTTDSSRLRRAINLVRSRRCQNPSSCAATWAWSAGLLQRAQDLPAALLALEKASEQDPQNPDFLYQQVVLCQKMNANERALQILRKIVARFPGYQPARIKLSELQSSH